MITVGIHDNLRVYKAVKNDKGTLVIGIKEEKATGSLLDLLNSNTENSTGGSKDQDFLMYCPKVTNFDGTPDTGENNLKKVQEFKDTLTHILLNYMTSDKIQWDIMAGTDITVDNITERFTQQTVVDKVYENIIDQFITMIRPFTGQTNKLHRMLLIRKSATSHFPKFRSKFLDTNPFMEPMTVPKEQSRLKFTKWEVANGFSSPDKVEDGESVPSEQTAATSSVFNR